MRANERTDERVAQYCILSYSGPQCNVVVFVVIFVITVFTIVIAVVTIVITVVIIVITVIISVVFPSEASFLGVTPRVDCEIRLGMIAPYTPFSNQNSPCSTFGEQTCGRKLELFARKD